MMATTGTDVASFSATTNAVGAGGGGEDEEGLLPAKLEGIGAPGEGGDGEGGGGGDADGGDEPGTPHVVLTVAPERASVDSNAGFALNAATTAAAVGASAAVGGVAPIADDEGEGGSGGGSGGSHTSRSGGSGDASAHQAQEQEDGGAVQQQQQQQQQSLPVALEATLSELVLELEVGMGEELTKAEERHAKVHDALEVCWVGGWWVMMSRWRNDVDWWP
jgi:hypothetical protein